MAFIQCKLCNRVREVQPHGPAYSTSGYCRIHLNNRLFSNNEEYEPVNTPKRKVIVLDKA